MRSFGVLVVVCLNVLMQGSTSADYRALTLSELFGGSELIVLGEVESADDDGFILREPEVFIGDIGAAPLRVKKYMDWTGGRRWNTYRAGQTVLLFLEKRMVNDNSADSYWLIRGLGGEGEMPIEDGAIFPHGLNLKGFQRKIFNVDGGELYGYRFDLEVFISALKGYLHCFRSPRDATAHAVEGSKSYCSEEELAAYRMTSALHCYLTPSTLRE